MRFRGGIVKLLGRNLHRRGANGGYSFCCRAGHQWFSRFVRWGGSVELCQSLMIDRRREVHRLCGLVGRRVCITFC